MRSTWSKSCFLLAALAVWMLPAALLWPEADAGAAVLLDEGEDADVDELDQEGELALLFDDAADKDGQHDGNLTNPANGDEEEGDCDKHEKDSPLSANPEDDEGDHGDDDGEEDDEGEDDEGQ
jgi:hypothetical protein